MTLTPLGPWEPDKSELNLSIARDVINVIPSIEGMLPFPSFSSITSALTAKPQGAASFRSKTGVVHNFAGDTTKLYKMATDGLSYTDVSRLVGGAYATAIDGWWHFAQYGDFVIASNGVDNQQVYDMTVGGNFALLAGSSTISVFNGTIKQFAILARQATDYNKIQWSALGNHASWAASATTLAGSQEFADGGIIKGFVGGDYGVVLQERSIRLMTFEGPHVVFSFSKISNTLGCWIERSVNSYENMVFFCSHDGFKLLRGGNEITSIGFGKIDSWFLSKINSTYTYNCSSAIDPERKLYLFSFPSLASTSGVPDTILMYHWLTGQWSKAEVNHSMIMTAAAQSTYTIDGLDALSATIDGLVYPFDSLFYAGIGNLIAAGFNTTFQQGFFSGSSMAATVETGDVQFTQGRKSMLRGLRIMIEGTSVTPSVTIKSRDRLQDVHSTGTAVATNSNGYCPLRVNARYHRAKITIPAATDWVRVTGFDDAKFSAMGAR